VKLLKSCWITAICLNFLILAERLVQRIIIQWTGYFIPNENFGAFVQFTVGFTVFTLIATLIRQFSYFERQRRKHQQERSFHHLYLLLFTLLYGSIGLFVSMLINFWSIIQARKAIYYSPSGNKAVVFLERANFFDGSSVYACQQKGFLRKCSGNYVFMAEYGDSDSIQDEFFDPAQIDIQWSETEENLRWELKQKEPSISGKISFE